MSDLKELLYLGEELRPEMGLRAYLRPEPGDFLMFQTESLDIPLLVEFDRDAGLIRASARVNSEWQGMIMAPAPRLASDSELKLEIRFSIDAAEIWIASSLLLYFPMELPPASIRKLFGTAGITYAEQQAVADPAPAHHGNVLYRLRDRFRPMPGDNLIYDIGMGDAADTDFYLKKGFCVVAIEPNATAIAAAVRRFAPELRSGRLVLANMGVATEVSVYPFFTNIAIPGWSSFITALAARGHEVTENKVMVAPLARFFDMFGVPYYAKCWTEGYDNLVLTTLAQADMLPRHVSVAQASDQIVKTLAALGYSRMKLIAGEKIVLLRCQRRAREGAMIDYRFGSTSIGPFGAEVPGSWQATEGISRALALHAKGGAPGGNQFLHATLPD